MIDPGRLASAFSLTANIHGDQRRKGSGVPYLTHLMAVSAMVGEFGGDEDLMIAALLHDALEDQPDRVTVEEIVARFGWRVARVVLGCSDCRSKPKPPWEERKRAFVQRLASESSEVRLVTAADKLHNTIALVRAVRDCGDDAWKAYNAPKEKQCWYLRSCVQALRTGWSHPIVELLDEAVTELERLCGVSSSA
jgi:(p)ppGpp synthase/HD superfamily hydrolase